MMGREFASAAARWHHLTAEETAPEITAICSRTLDAGTVEWFRRIAPGIRLVTADYTEVLASPDVDAVYIAVPNHLHEEMYTAAIAAGKHLMGEKPFGIGLKANTAILDACRENPEVFVRCASQYYFSPAAQQLCAMFGTGSFGRILEMDLGFKHSSDLNPDKPINWKRMNLYNGEYGVMGDLGMHVCAVPFRAGIVALDVRAVLTKVFEERPDGAGGRAACDTWDNAVLLCSAARAESSGGIFPMTMKFQRIAPGEKNTWYISVYGTRASARISTKNINRIEVLEYGGGDRQSWQVIDTGHETVFPTVTAKIFEFGGPDHILQMWASFIHEFGHRKVPGTFAGCVTPEETALSHR
ncbi:MAG: Gfo/Idh/MocA family oxidoreductase, partial [Spirochaetales bacterium]